MAAVRVGWLTRYRTRLQGHLADKQHRNAYYLLLGNLVSAAAGLGFWFLLAAVLALPPAAIGFGYAVFSLGTLVGVVAKGGLDTALVRSVPEAGHKAGFGLLVVATLIGVGLAVAVASLLLAFSWVGGDVFGLGATGWAMVAAIAVFLVVTWLQDAYFIGEGDARWCFHRNAVLSAARLVLPFPVVLLALPHPVAFSWALALVLSAAAAAMFVKRLPVRAGGVVPMPLFLKRALRNVTGTAAEFLPGFLLVPVILAVAGPEQAGFFGIAWTAAALLFVASAAISRSALSEMVRVDGHGEGTAVRKAARQHAMLLLPAAVVGVLLAPQIMGIFGSDYAREAAIPFALLCASIVFVAPGYLYLALLRARDRTLVLTLFPVVMMVVLFSLAAVGAHWMGLRGVAVAWLLANLPFGLFGGWRLARLALDRSQAGAIPREAATATGPKGGPLHAGGREATARRP